MSSDIEEIKRRILRRWEREISKPRLKGKLSFEESFQMLVNRCMTCPPEERAENIEMLFYATPTSWKDEELYEKLEECTEEVEYTTYQKFSGVTVMDCDDMPPKVWKQTEVDWKRLFNSIIDCANRRNLLIPMERAEVATEEG